MFRVPSPLLSRVRCNSTSNCSSRSFAINFDHPSSPSQKPVNTLAQVEQKQLQRKLFSKAEIISSVYNTHVMNFETHSQQTGHAHHGSSRTAKDNGNALENRYLETVNLNVSERCAVGEVDSGKKERKKFTRNASWPMIAMIVSGGGCPNGASTQVLSKWGLAQVLVMLVMEVHTLVYNAYTMKYDKLYDNWRYLFVIPFRLQTPLWRRSVLSAQYGSWRCFFE